MDPKAGVIVWKRAGRQLIGQWTHVTTGGLLASEIVSNIEPGATTGRWPVEIRAPDGTVIFEGELSSETLGQTLALEWRGRKLPSGDEGVFKGVGIVIDSDSIAASFEQM